MTAPQTPFDALRYGLRALDEMSRAQASVLAPPRTDDRAFAPHPFVRAPLRDGAALSLRMFSGAADDATDFVLRAADEIAFPEAPARAATLFEALAAAMVYGDDDELTVGFPLVSFVESGARRAAPLLFWSGARASWRLGESPWRLPPGAQLGAPINPPTGLILRASPADADEPAFALHAGLWRQLLDVDGAALSSLAHVGRANTAALVRAATAMLTQGADDPLDAPDESPLTRDDVVALVEAAVARASPRLALQAHPHALVMLLPRGDPTSGLRADLRAMLKTRAPRTGPLAVLLGAKPAPAARAPLWTHGEAPPTPSQLDAARAFEGTSDLVALRGPPGCGKTTLLHHLVAQSIVDLALGDTWLRPPASSAPWALVVTSTNNAAVDHALAPFVRGRALPVGVRLGNRKTLAEATALTLREALDALNTPGGETLAKARAAFEALAAGVRAHQKSRAAAGDVRARNKRNFEKLCASRDALLALLDGPRVEVNPAVSLGEVCAAREALKAHAKAALLVGPLVVGGSAESRARGRGRWAKANALRVEVILPVLAQLSMPLPFRDLDANEDATASLERQHAAMARTLEALDVIESSLRAPQRQSELDALLDAIARAEREHAATPAPTPDPALVEAALGVRDAWCRAHRDTLCARIDEVLSLLDDARRSRGLAEALAGLAAVFPVAGCTLLSLRASFDLDPDVIDRLVVDEAGQCAPIYTAPALARASRALITGDVAQLPPVYTLDDRLDARLARDLDPTATEPFRMGASSTTSAQSLAERRAGASLALVEHFRSQPEIVALASRWSGYALDVRTPARSLSHLSRILSQPVRVFDVRGRGARAAEGVVNEAEVSRVVALVSALLRDGVSARDLAVLTPFVGQSVRIERELVALGLLYDGGVLVRTVHKLQGGERRVVVFSVTATETKHLRWLASRPHLLHVAASRAQDHLLVFLDASRAASEPLLGPLVEAAARVTGARRPGAL